MARKERNNVDYFPHPVNHGKGMYFMRHRYGNDGFAVWFILLEKIGVSSFHHLDLKDDIQKMYLSSECLVEEVVLLNMINDLVKLGEFDKELWENESILWNQKFVDSISDAYKKRSNNVIDKNSLLLLLESKGRCKPSKGTHKQPISSLNGVDNPQSKVEYSKVKKTKVTLTPENFTIFNEVVSFFDIKNYKEKSWIDCYDKLIRIDGYSEQEIYDLVSEFRSDGNWWKDSGNFNTLLKLRQNNKEGIKFFQLFKSKSTSKINTHNQKVLDLNADL